MPVNLRNHWILLKINKLTKDITVYDSINIRKKTFMTLIKKLLS